MIRLPLAGPNDRRVRTLALLFLCQAVRAARGFEDAARRHGPGSPLADHARARAAAWWRAAWSFAEVRAT